MIHVVSGWVAVGGHPGAELALCGAAPQGCCSHQGTAWSWGGGGWGEGFPPCWGEHRDVGSDFPTCSWDCLLFCRI